MTKRLKNRLLREALDLLLLCIVIATAGGLSINHHIQTVIKRTVADIYRTEWVKAARLVEPSLETLGGDADRSTSKH